MKQTLIGHQKVKGQLEKALVTGNLHSTLLFSGAEGVGKKTVAMALAKGILCHHPDKILGGCGSCKSCTLIESRNHPDHLIIDFSDKDEVKADSIRYLISSFQVKPYLQHGRVVILDHAEHLSIAGSNILLKTFEEPQPGNTFILVSANASRLPITLRSRCQVWAFGQFSTEELRAVLTEEAKAGTLTDEIISLSDGSIGNAKLLMKRSQELSHYKEILRKLYSGDAGFLYDDLMRWAKSKEELPELLHLLRLIGRDHLFRAADDEERATWASFVTELNNAFLLIQERNLNPLLVLCNVFLTVIPHPKMGHAFTRVDMDDTLTALLKG